LFHPNFQFLPVHASHVHGLRAVFYEVTHSSAAEALRLNFVSGLSSRVNVHQHGVTGSWCGVGKARGKVVCGWKILDSGSGRRSGRFGLWGRKVSGSEGSIGGLILVKVNSSFVPGFQVEVVRPSRSHSGYCICYRGVKSLSEFDYDGFRIRIPGVIYQVSEVIEIVVHGLSTLEVGGSLQFVCCHCI